MSLAVYLIEAGLLLAAAPWTEFWLRNYFAARWPFVALWMEATTFRVAVVTTGALMITCGAIELRAALTPRSRTLPTASAPGDVPPP